IVAEKYGKSFYYDANSGTYQPSYNYWYNYQTWINSSPYWAPTSNFPAGALIQPQPHMNTSKLDENLALNTAVHAPRLEGILVGLADGSGRLVSAQLDTTTWINACDPADGNVLSAEWNQ